MAKPELGAKRQCQSCATKFYDMNRDPILCPKCGTVFQVTALSRIVARATEEEVDLKKDDPETISLTDVEEAEAKVDSIDPVDDVDLEEADAEADDTFLEAEEEDDDDVSGLIDGDLEGDEEV